MFSLNSYICIAVFYKSLYLYCSSLLVPYYFVGTGYQMFLVSGVKMVLSLVSCYLTGTRYHPLVVSEI